MYFGVSAARLKSKASEVGSVVRGLVTEVHIVLLNMFFDR